MKFNVIQMVTANDGTQTEIVLAKRVDELSAIANLTNVLANIDDERWFTTNAVLVRRCAMSQDEDRCLTYHELDRKFGTVVESPLHHDNNCPIHGGKK